MNEKDILYVIPGFVLTNFWRNILSENETLLSVMFIMNESIKAEDKNDNDTCYLRAQKKNPPNVFCFLNIFKSEQYDIKIKNSTNRTLIIIYNQDHIVSKINDLSSKIGASINGGELPVELKNNILHYSSVKSKISLYSSNTYPIFVDEKGIYINSYFIDSEGEKILINQNVYLKKSCKYIFEQCDINAVYE